MWVVADRFHRRFQDRRIGHGRRDQAISVLAFARARESHTLRNLASGLHLGRFLRIFFGLDGQWRSMIFDSLGLQVQVAILNHVFGF